MIRRPRRTVRMRLTALYCLLFVLSSIALLTVAAITNLGQGPVPVQQSLPEHSEISRYLRSSVIALGEMTVVSVAAGWLVAGRVLRPLRAMTATTRRISADNLHERLAIGGPGDGLKDLADTIDALLGRLNGAFAAQRRFVANASHELRTPLATMRVSVDVAVARPGPVPPETITLAGQVRTELDKVDELLEGLLALARAQHGVLPGHAVLSLDGIVAAALAAQAGAIAAGNLTVQHAGGDGIWVEGSQPLLRRMADNVIGNAVSHNRDGGWIRITATAGDGAARLVIENGGDILDPAQVAELAQPLRRLGAERTGSDDGTGLGLSIVAATAEVHGGSLDLQARPGGGLDVTITLPLAPRAPVAAGAGDRAGVPA